MIFWNSAEISLVFCQCKRSLQSRRYYSDFWSRDTWPSAESPDRSPRRNAHFTCTVTPGTSLVTRVRSKVERSRSCAPLTKTQKWDSGFFAHALFVPKTPNVMGFSGSVNGTTKNPGFLDFGFCQCKWAYVWHICKTLWGVLKRKVRIMTWGQKKNCYVALTRPKSENWVGRSIFFIFFLKFLKEELRIFSTLRAKSVNIFLHH